MTNLVITVGHQNWPVSPAEQRLARSFEEIAVAFRQHLDRRQITTAKETMNPLNQTDVANLRESIRATVTHLSGKTVPEAETALQKHLEFLLAQERALFTTVVAVQKPDTPWYPDASGKWVEVPPGSHMTPLALDSKTKVEALLHSERGSKTYQRRVRAVLNWPHHWWSEGNIVAYKIVE